MRNERTYAREILFIACFALVLFFGRCTRHSENSLDSSKAAHYPAKQKGLRFLEALFC